MLTLQRMSFQRLDDAMLMGLVISIVVLFISTRRLRDYLSRRKQQQRTGAFSRLAPSSVFLEMEKELQRTRAAVL